MMNCSVVIPVYNSAETLPELVVQLRAVLPTFAERYEAILVNDGSADRSWEVIAALAKEHAWVRGIDLLRNYGQQNALLAGIRAAQYEVTVTMDDDLEHLPAGIPVLVKKLDEGYDLVFGTPENPQHGLWREAASVLTKLAIVAATGIKIAPAGCSFRAFRTRLRDAFAEYSSPYVSIDVLLAWGTTRYGVVPLRHSPRRLGRSNYTLRKLVGHALELTTGFSTWPLRVASLLGFALTLGGMIVLVLVAGEHLRTGNPLSVFRFFAAIIAVFSGTQLFALGIMGEYLARIHLRMMGRPAYAIRERAGRGAEGG